MAEHQPPAVMLVPGGRHKNVESIELSPTDVIEHRDGGNSVGKLEQIGIQRPCFLVQMTVQ